ncbi:oxidoreductase [Fusarium denticulatum]|uniref:Oxidoreductase n=1 Tax=Fusarium denticulatum TaxID=48507 RepID=A0A8H5T6I7_9HYPO|nr:oxidoreductase [Fusarium denticulatum]
MADRYVTIHESPNGPGDSRPTAIQIIKDEGLEGKLNDQVVFITGCSAGIGIETAKALHLTGATLYLTARDLEKAKSALGDLAQDERVHLLELDLESLENVRSCAAKFLSECPKLNILICNAGVMCTPEGRTKEGFETQFGTNHLAHFLLFQLLKPALAKGATSDRASRVIMLSSLAHRFGEVNFDNVNMEGCYDPNKAYSQSKTANLWTANEIERRYANEGIHAWSVQPGGVLTDLGKHLSEEQKSGLAVDPYLKTIWKLPDQGAATSVWAAVAQALEGQGGKYLEDCQIVGKWDASTPLYARGYGEHACDTEKAVRLWDKSLEWLPKALVQISSHPSDIIAHILPVRLTPQQATRTTMVSWNQLPPEIRGSILDSLYQQYRHKHIYAAVYSEWRTFMEERTFRTLRITQRRLLGLEDPRLYANCSGNLHHMRLVYPLLMGLKDLSPRPRAAIQHLWLNIELLGPGCPECGGYPTPIRFNARFPQAEYYLYRLFKILSSWDCTERDYCISISRRGRTATPVTSHPKTRTRRPAFRNVSSSDALNELFILKGTADDLIANIHPSTLRTLTVFQDYCHKYVRFARRLYDPTRVYVDNRRWVRENTKQFAARNLDLQVLSVSFLASAEDFFSDCQSDWTWKNLQTIILTTRQFNPDIISEAVSAVLQSAAQVALRMPRLETMVLWNTKRMRHATSFTYRRTKLSATIAWCSTMDLDFDPYTVRAWEEVARKHGQPYLWREKRRTGKVGIISHGHAIRLLELPPQVIDPESRRQIEKEFEVARIPGVHCTPCNSGLGSWITKRLGQLNISLVWI